MNYDDFANMVRQSGLQPRQCNPEHWQIRGGKFIVNFYPTTRRGSRYYVNCAARGVTGDLSEALQSAAGEFTLQPRKKRRRNVSGGSRKKRRLMNEHSFCAECGIPLTKEIARLDHKLPVSRGGSDDLSNLQLLCSNCDIKKGNKLPVARETTT